MYKRQGSLLLEMGVLSRLLDDPVYEGYARRANKALWNARSRTTGLLGEQNLFFSFNLLPTLYNCNLMCFKIAFMLKMNDYEMYQFCFV